MAERLVERTVETKAAETVDSLVCQMVEWMDVSLAEQMAALKVERTVAKLVGTSVVRMVERRDIQTVVQKGRCLAVLKVE